MAETNKPCNNKTTPSHWDAKYTQKQYTSQNSEDDIPFSFFFPPTAWISAMGVYKLNQPKQNTEATEQSPEENFV